LFITKRDTEYAIGVFRNNSILWISDSLPGEYSGGDFEAVFDFNKDGYVDIKTDWHYADNIKYSDVWIFSWDGSRGWLINDVNENGRTAINYYCMLEDINGNGIYELVGERPVLNQQGEQISNEKFAYIWNGSKYVSGISTPEKKTTVANNFTASLHVKVVKQSDSYEYKYLISNDIASIQPIKYLFISDSTKSSSGIVSNGWKYIHIVNPSFSSFISLDKSVVGNGQALDSLIVYSTGLPRISNYYAQAPYSFINYSLADTSFLNRVINENIYTNSFINKTVSPVDYLNSIIPLNILDTVSSYTMQSRSLGWIKDQTTADKYLGYFASAKTKLVQKDSVGARTILLQVLHDVNIDSSTSLSSEAYALLSFNTEYVVNILPQAQVAPFFAVKLVSSAGTKLTTGTLQYYDSVWKDASNNNDGTFFVNTALKTLSLRMTYEYGTQTKSNVSISTDTIVFRTVNTQVQLQNSQGTLIDTGKVQYYAGAWRSFGTTSNGIAAKELLPGTYSFRMTYANASKDQQQDIGTNSTVIFQTVKAQVQLQNSSGALMDTGSVQYYSGAWLPLGTTSSGVSNKELLPNSYSFRMTYASASKDKQQDISTNPTVVFQTVKAEVQLQNSSGALVDTGVVQYYSGAWLPLGVTVSGVATKELLPNSYSFRMNYAYASKDKQQDIGFNATVIFQTVNTAAQLKNSSGVLMDTGTVQYYSGAWRTFGTTTNGIANKELLPNSYSFRMIYAYASLDKTQDLSTNSTVGFATVLCTINAKDAQGNPVNNAQASYYSGAWRIIGMTVNGQITKELLPVSLSFRVSYNGKTQDKTQNLSTDNIVDFVMP
jgi:hypothetical protein